MKKKTKFEEGCEGPDKWFVATSNVHKAGSGAEYLIVRLSMEKLPRTDEPHKKQIETKDVLEHFKLLGFKIERCVRFDFLNNFNPKHFAATWHFLLKKPKQKPPKNTSKKKEKKDGGSKS